MKKILVIVGGLLVLFVAALLIIPVFFKDEILALVKEQANKNLTADVNFSDADISLLRSFPRLHLALDSVSIVNRTPVQDTLVSMTSLALSVDLWSYLASDKLDILSAALVEPRVYAHVYKDSTNNWSIFPEEEVAGAPAVTVGNDNPAAKISINLQDYSIENGTLVYEDEPGDMMAMIRNLDHSGSGDFTDDLFTLETETSGVVVFRNGNIDYLSNVDTRLDADFEMDMQKKKFTFKDNRLSLNNLPIRFDGYVALPEEGMDIDMKFAALETEFRNVLSLIPAIYLNNYKELKSSGTVALEGTVKGRMTDSLLPAFNLKLLVANGMFQYPDLPQPVRNVQVDLAVSNPGGTPDHTVIDLQRMHVELGGDPFDMHMVVKTPVSDPYIDATMKGRLNLGALNKSMPLDKGTEIGGVLVADVQARGNLSALDTRQYERFVATGVVVAQNIVYATPDMPEKVVVKTANLAFSPQTATLSNLAVTLGKSDISGEGRLDNIIGYVLTDRDLQGSLTVSSGYFNLNPWLGISGQEQPAPAAAQPSATPAAQTGEQKPDLPGGINFTVNARMKEVVYDNLTLRNIVASLTLRDKVMALQSASMDLLGGSMTMKGTYDTRVPEKPKSDFSMAIKNFSIAESFDKFTTLQAFVPFLDYMQGSFDASATLETSLDENLRPILPSVGSVGSLIIDRIRIEGFKPFSQAASLLKINELNNPTIANVAPKYEIRNGRFILPPMNFKLGQYPAKISGSNGLDKTLDYVMTLTLPAGKLQQQTNAALSKLLKTDVQAMKSSTIDVAVLIKGTVDNPQISTSLADVVQSQVDAAAKALEDAAKQRLEEEKQKLEQKLQEEREKLEQQAKQAEAEAKRKLEEEKEKLRQKAKEEEERLKKKAEEEKEKAKKKLEEELKKRNPFNKP